MLDIVPCDHVVNAILAVCATQPTIGQPEYYHVSSGARNPLTFNDMYGHIRELLPEHPLEGGPAGRGPAAGVAVPGRGLGGAAAVHLRTGAQARRAGASSPAPRSDRTRKIASDLDRIRGRLDFLRRYHSLYNEYAQSELHFVDDNTLALTNVAATPTTRRSSPSTPRSTTGRPTSRTCTAPRSPRRSAGWTRCAASAATGRPR